MCILVRAFKKIDKEIFKNCWDSNFHGFGVAYKKRGKTFFKKGFLKFEDAWEYYNSAPIKGEHILHFRFASAGEICKELTHPFIISSNGENPLEGFTDKSLLFHNGHIYNYETILINLVMQGYKIPELYSDTSILAIALEKNPNLIDYIKGGKFIIFGGETTKMKGDFILEDNVYYSNSSFKKFYYSESFFKRSWEKKEFYR